MNIYELKEKIKGNGKDIALISIFLLVSLMSFGLGRLSAIRELKVPLKIEGGNTNPLNLAQKESVAAIDINRQNDANLGLSGTEPDMSSPPGGAGKGEKLFVASKSGTKYYYPWCSGVSRIKEGNKVWFASADEANKAGYSPASNCKGLR